MWRPRPCASPTVRGLVDYLNDNAARLQTLKVEDMSIDATMGTQSIALQGILLAEKPRVPPTAPNFRMKANFFGKNEVDIGSTRTSSGSGGRVIRTRINISAAIGTSRPAASR